MTTNRTRLVWSKLSNEQLKLLRDFGNTLAIRRRARHEIVRREDEQARVERKMKR